MKKVSLIIPCYNEAEGLPAFDKEINRQKIVCVVLGKLKYLRYTLRLTGVVRDEIFSFCNEQSKYEFKDK